MVGQIRVTPDQMDAAARRVHQQTEEWNNIVQQIRGRIEEMRNMWQGEGSDTFLNTFMVDYQYFQQLGNLMAEYNHAIAIAAQKYRQGEESVRGIVSQR